MRRPAATLAMAVALLAAHLATHLVNAWYLDVQLAGVQTFRHADEIRLMAVLPLLTAVVGITVVSIAPVWMLGGWAMPDWLWFVLQFADGLALVVWAGAAVAVIGMAEGVRWAALPLRSSAPTTVTPSGASQPVR